VTPDQALSEPNSRECGSRDGAALHQRQWFCVRTAPRREDDVASRLVDQGFETFIPKVLVHRRVKSGVTEIAAVPAFPGYVLVRFCPRRDRWRPICFTRGVKGLISSSPESPVSIPSTQVRILIEAGLDGVLHEDPRPALIEAGAPLRVTSGPFADAEGVCVLDDGRRVSMLLSLLGGQRTIRVAKATIEVRP
jgi:transcription antitermination factor NusG